MLLSFIIFGNMAVLFQPDPYNNNIILYSQSGIEHEHVQYKKKKYTNN